MKRIFIFLLLLPAIQLLAQPPFAGQGKQGPSIKGRVTGIVVDSLLRTPVEFATIELLDAKGEKQITGDITNEKGQFRLNDISNGSYTVRITFLGYATRTIPAVALTLERPDADLGQILLASENIQLTEVTVTGEAALVENKIDKIVYNAEKDVSTAGGDAAEVLRRVPLLSVDLDGNVSLRGSSNVQILINGRPSGIFAASIADALKTIPADQIKSVEVITTPGARYDAEGSAGIINIITKKKSIEGFSGSVNTSVGTRQNSAGLNLSLAKGRMGINGNANTFFSWPREASQTFNREDYLPNLTRVVSQEGTSTSTVLGYNGSFSGYYDFNAFNSISSNIRYNGFNNWLDGATAGTFSDELVRAFERTNINNRFNNGFDWTTDYRRTFPNSEREIVAAFQVTNSFSNRDNEINQVDLNGNDPSLTRWEMNLNDGLNAEYTGQIDYVHPFSKALKLETGAKAVIRRIDSDYRFEVYDWAGMQFITNPAGTDVFGYDQDVYAGYASLTAKIAEKYGIQAGLRYEHTRIAGEYQSERDPFNNSYDNLLPSVILSRTFKNFSTLKLSFTQRIQRPSLNYINPFLEIADPFNVNTGNPNLEPELSSQVEVSYGAFVKGFNINAAVFYRHTRDVIESFLTVNPNGVSETNFLNIGQNQSFGADLFISTTIKQVLTLRGGINALTYDAEGVVDGQTLENQAILLNGNLAGTLTIKKVWKAEAFGFFRAPRQTLQGITPTFSLFSFGFNRDIFNKKGSIGIRIVEPFVRNKDFYTELESPGKFTQTSNFSIPFRSYGINFNLRFGKMDTRQQQRPRRSIRNEDLKEGNENNI